MTKTPEQAAADDALSQALVDACKAYGHLEEGWAIGDYVIAIEYTPFSDEFIGRERYGYVLPSDYLPTHRVLGLLDVTTRAVREQSEDEE